MHEYRRFVQREMDQRGWNPNQTAQYAGLNRQTVYDLVQDTRDVLPRVPSDRTINGLSKAFGVGREVILAHVALAMGLPTSVTRAELTDLSDADLLTEVRKRMEARHDRQGDTQQRPETGSTVDGSEDRREDGSTPSRRQTPMSAEEQQAELDNRPVKDLLGLAADKERKPKR